MNAQLDLLLEFNWSIYCYYPKEYYQLFLISLALLKSYLIISLYFSIFA